MKTVEHEPNGIGQAAPAESIEQRLTGMRERFQAEQAQWKAFMAAQPQTIPCKFHPDCVRQIEREASRETSSYTFKEQGTGDYYGGEPITAGYARCPQCVQETKSKDLKKFGVPENLIHATFENFMPENQIEANHVAVVKAFCDRRTGFLFVLGGYGTGKTHLGVAALRNVGGGWLVKQGTLLRLLRATYTDRKAGDPIDRAQSTRLLVLDDVGLSSGGRDELPMLHEILDHRHGERLPTIITSNLPFENLSAVLGERMADRLRESTFRVLTFASPSRRRDARERYFDAPPAEPPVVPVENQNCL